MKCPNCDGTTIFEILNLGLQPPSNALLSHVTEFAAELRYPLRLLQCLDCYLVHTEQVVTHTGLFNHNYPYMSGYSSIWRQHCRDLVTELRRQFGLNGSSVVCEVAANDGTLLQMFEQFGAHLYGIEPTLSTARIAAGKGLRIYPIFLGRDTAIEILEGGERSCDILVANNVLAHVPNLADFVDGCKELLKPDGVAVFEFQYLLNLIEHNQFDTIYHEHFSYLTLGFVDALFRERGLRLFDAERLPTHGGSLRVYATRSRADLPQITRRLRNLLLRESRSPHLTPSGIEAFASRVQSVAIEFRQFLESARDSGRVVAGYGAAAKGNTLLNFCQVDDTLMKYVVDENPAKQFKFLPGSHIKVVPSSVLDTDRPDFVVILPWNLAEEIQASCTWLRQRGVRLMTVIPEMRELN